MRSTEVQGHVLKFSNFDVLALLIMASALARQALHLACNRIIAPGSSRKINTTACSKLSPSCDFFFRINILSISTGIMV